MVRSIDFDYFFVKFWNSVLLIFFSVDIPFLTFNDLGVILFGEAISLATGIFLVRCNQVRSPSVNS